MSNDGKTVRGVIVPMITPFTADGRIDRLGTERLIRHIDQAGAYAFLLGTTGESASISQEQRACLIETARRSLPADRPLYVGISGNCLEESLSAGRLAANLGVSAAVAHLPCYYPIDAEQMLCYYQRLADGLPIPLILYNMPATTHLSIPLAVVDQLSHHPNIIALKDSEKGLERLHSSLDLWAGRDDFAFLVGCAAQSAEALLRGADGIVPSTGNLFPGLYLELYRAALAGDEKTAREYQALTDRISAVYQGGRSLSRSLAALKLCAAGLGLCESHVISPLLPINGSEAAEIAASIAQFKQRQSTPLAS
ncbi:MAG: dihydrodipicolinate synthase family protein [Acidobacteria bacterium]|nr:MAG: dihydrodipicolinate synthase family protein [Acidobacteriota bacterium]